MNFPRRDIQRNDSSAASTAALVDAAEARPAETRVSNLRACRISSAAIVVAMPAIAVHDSTSQRSGSLARNEDSRKSGELFCVFLLSFSAWCRHAAHRHHLRRRHLRAPQNLPRLSENSRQLPATSRSTIRNGFPASTRPMAPSSISPDSSSAPRQDSQMAPRPARRIHHPRRSPRRREPKSMPNSTFSLPPRSKADSPPVPPPPTSSPSSVGTRSCSIPKARSPTTSTTPPP